MGSKPILLGLPELERILIEMILAVIRSQCEACRDNHMSFYPRIDEFRSPEKAWNNPIREYISTVSW